MTTADLDHSPKREHKLPGDAIFATVSSLSTISSDLAKPFNSLLGYWILAALIAVLLVFLYLYYRSRKPARLITALWTVLPIALCVLLLVKAPKVDKGEVNPGAIANNVQVIEVIQSYILPLNPGAKQQLQFDVVLKGSDQVERLNAIKAIGENDNAGLRRILYKRAVQFNDPDVLQAVGFEILSAQKFQNIPLELAPGAPANAFSSLVDGAQFKIDNPQAANFHLAAFLGLGQHGTVLLEGKMSGPELHMSGLCNLDGQNYNLVLSLTLKPDLQMTGTLHFVGGAVVPVKLEPF